MVINKGDEKMVKILIGLAVLQIIMGLCATIFASLPVFWMGLISSIISAILIVALAIILSNQEDILYKLEQQEERLRKLSNNEKKVCTKCNYSYDIDYKSCPNCGKIQEN